MKHNIVVDKFFVNLALIVFLIIFSSLALTCKRAIKFYIDDLKNNKGKIVSMYHYNMYNTDNYCDNCLNLIERKK